MTEKKTRTATRTWLGCATVIVALLLAGCGSGAKKVASAPSTASTPATTAATTTTPSARRHVRRHAGAHSRAAGRVGGRTTSGGHAATHTTTPPANGQPAQLNRAGFLHVANQVCRGIRHRGSVPGPPPAQASQLRSYAEAVLPNTVLTFLSLNQFTRATGHRTAVSQLLVDYQNLIALLSRAAGRGGGVPGGGPGAPKPRPYAFHGPVGAQQIAAAQQRARAEARALSLPFCSPLGAGA